MIAALVRIAAVAVVLGVVAVLAIALDQPLLVPSLAACVFLQTLLPDSDAAKPWAVAVGQASGLAAALVAVHALGVAHLPPFESGHPLAPMRTVAAIAAACGTMVLQLALRAGNAAGAALAATIALGAATADVAGALHALAGIAVVALLGEAARRIILVVEG